VPRRRGTDLGTGVSFHAHEPDHINYIYSSSNINYINKINNEVDINNLNAKIGKNNQREQSEPKPHQEPEVSQKVVKFIKKEAFGDRELLIINNCENVPITYDKLQGRPSVKVRIENIEIECLLDTGAALNVMTEGILKNLNNIRMEQTNQRLTAANGLQMDVRGEIETIVKIGNKAEKIRFVIVKNLRPEMIGGIPLMKEFGIELQWKERNYQETERTNICEIEAKFGKEITNENRVQEALKVIDTKNDKILEKIIHEYGGVFMANDWDIGRTNLLQHRIETTGGPINIKPRRQPVHLENKLEEAIKNLEKNGIIKPCNSEWNTPIVCVWKKDKDEIRLCLDFRQLNQITKRQAFPMPNIAEMMDRLHGTKYFSTIDLGNAYYQVELDKESQEKTAFSTKAGQFCFKRMPFGIAAAPGTFQELMTKVLQPIKKGASVYLDDILIATSTKEEHYKVIREVFERILQTGLRIKPAKCKMLRPEVKFLGHIINDQGIQTDPEKIAAIENFQRPKCIKNLRSFLGICNYYRRFIKGYAKKAKVLEGMCGLNKEKLIWTDACEIAFKDMKEALITAPILSFPDFEKQFILDTDASFDSIGAVLSQISDSGKEQVIAYGSHSMSAHEKGYCITRKELLAIFYFCQHFNHYLYGKRFKLRTDHKAITFMFHTKKPLTAQFQTWMNYLSSLDIEIEYRKGVLHGNADMLSRQNCDTCTQCQMEHEEAKKGKNKTRLLAVTTRSQARAGMKEWIPKEKRSDLIIQTHRLLCHAGAEKVYEYLRDKFDMEEEKKTVKDVVGSCMECQRTKTITTKTKEENIKITTSEIFEKVYIDICGPWNETVRKERYILGIIDHFSKYVSLTAIKRQDEETIVQMILQKWILKFGAPKEIHVDCGKCFEAKKVKEMLEAKGIELIFSSPYHHNTNGIIERQFRTIREFIQASLKERNATSWADILPEVEFAINATKQKTIGCSPAEVVFGKKIDRQKWYDNSKINREDTRIRLKEKNKPEENVTRRIYKVGEKVWIQKENRKKGEDRFEGPYEIIEKIHERSYKLKDKNGRQLIRNVEKFKNFKNEGDVGVTFGER
jgi:transposase InsO family protein/predicted aspartyl protease